ncbi:3'-5' exonuclease [Flavobacterium amniphilum]|uniref:3'-5' exonuclease n=1 Tax=Flavobacterium amniphilum TaxID=1834035 RepID=UPI002029E620|nr:3'-5' exonuclease [Flavobacterium amniphilum]MCL9804042.1 3'-5' exonuclease [Flavobacterium amniphilum]
MLDKIQLDNILFLDIETVPEFENFTDLDETKKELFDLKTRYQRKDDFTSEEFYDRAGIWAEFGKIICISVGYFTLKGDIRHFRVTSFFGDEIKILKDFSNLLNNHFSLAQHVLCGHNAKEFDFPFIARRMIIHNIQIPQKLNLFGKKPWEVPHLDTLELWKFGDFKHYTSLKLLTNVLGIQSPKDDIDGSEVARVFYVDNDIDRIVTYCEKDVIAVAQILLRLRREDLLIEDEIIHV